METKFVTLELGLLSSATELQRAIAHALQQHGDPLRWAITSVDRDRQTIQVEAVVTVGQVKPS